MMKVKSQARWVRISPRKLARVVEIVRGEPALKALEILRFMPQKGARILEKVVKSAVANARNNYKLAEDTLYIREAFVNKAVTMKRWQARARGRAFPIFKRSSHVTVWVSPAAEAEAKAPKEEKS